MTKRILFITLLLTAITNTFSQSKDLYLKAFDEIMQMLDGQKPLDFKRGVFVVENAYYGGEKSYKEFCQQIDDIEARLNHYIDYKGIRSNKLCRQFAIYGYMMEPQEMNNHKQCRYNFEDLMGNKDWSNMFVSRLIETKTGNCHSLPYLYKILAEDMGAEVYLAMAPNHLYIKHKDEKGGWVNVELTNGGFPRDVWIISSLSITAEAIKSGVYMSPLNKKETVALCLYDLVMGYQSQFGKDSLGIQICDSLTKHFPTCVNSYMIKSDILLQYRSHLLVENNQRMTAEIKTLENKITELYNIIDSLGYKDMPKEQYEQWAREAEKEMNNEKE